MSGEGATFCERCGYDLRGGPPKQVESELHGKPQHMPTWYLISGLVFLIFGFILLGVAFGGFIDDTADTDPFANPETDWPNIPSGLIIVSLIFLAIGGLLMVWSIVKFVSGPL
jgi:hypothetical protein